MNTDSAVKVQREVHLGRKALSIVTIAVLVGLLSLVGPDLGQASELRKATGPTTGKADLADPAGKAAAQQRSSLRKKKRKRRPPVRSWPLSLDFAEDRTDRYSESFFYRTEPAEFDPTDPNLVDVSWEDYYQDGCRRIGYSRVSCGWHVESDWVDFFDPSGGYLYTDFYVCESRLEVWHPRGRKKTTKQKASKLSCFWDSGRAG